jgi:hypothetical protein
MALVAGPSKRRAAATSPESRGNWTFTRRIRSRLPGGGQPRRHEGQQGQAGNVAERNIGEMAVPSMPATAFSISQRQPAAAYCRFVIQLAHLVSAWRVFS